MAPSRLTLAAPSGGLLARLTRSAPEARVEGSFLGRTLLLRIAGPQEDAERIAKALAAGGGSIEPGDAPSEMLVLMRGEVPERRLVEAVEAAGGVVLPPLRWEQGEVRVEVLQFTDALVGRVRGAVPGVRVQRKRPAGGDEAPSELLRQGLALPALTRKQAQAILAAMDAGYYDVPRKVTTLEVARKLGVARSTFEEHLKRAEAQFVGALAPVARLRVLEEEAARAAALRLYARYSEALGLYVAMSVRGDAVERVQLATQAPQGAEPDHPYLARILEHLQTGHGDLDDIPLHLEVGPFERKVLEVMRAIPAGEVMTYAQLAARLGKPGAARAVGNACARNPIPLIIPCHRVVPTNGGLGGYSAAGGVRTKAKLLGIEGVPPEAATHRPRRPRGGKA